MMKKAGRPAARKGAGQEREEFRMKEITLKWNENESITMPISKAKRKFTKYQECRDLGSYYEYASYSGYYRIDKKTKKVTLDTGTDIKICNNVEVIIN